VRARDVQRSVAIEPKAREERAQRVCGWAAAQHLVGEIVKLPSCSKQNTSSGTERREAGVAAPAARKRAYRIGHSTRAFKAQQMAKSKIAEAVARVAALVDSPGWNGPQGLREQVAGLLEALDCVSALQPPFVLVDSSRPFRARARRLLAWLATDAEFRCEGGALEVVDDLPASRGSRGVRTQRAIRAGAEIMRVPLRAVLSTETALESRELGPLFEQPSLRHLVSLPTLLLSLHLLVEHAKSKAAEEAERAACAGPSAGEGAGAGAGTGAGMGANAGAGGCAGGAGDACFEAEIPTSAAVLCGRSETEIAEDRSRSLQALGRGGGGGGGGAGGSGGCGAAPLRPTRLDLASHAWGSRFRAFIACLPEDAASIRNCLAWRAADFERLGDARLALTAARFVRDIAKGYASLYSVFAEAGAVRGLEPHFTWAHWRWAFACVMSRQNSMPGRRGGHHLVLAPLYDMVNHEPGPITSFFSTQHSAIELHAARDFGANEEITMSYGTRASEQLLQFQGFVPEGERSAAEDTATVAVLLGPPAPDALAPLRANILANLRVLAKAPVAPREVVFHAFLDVGDGRVRLPREMWSVCRVAALTKGDAAAALRLVQEATKVAAAAAATADAASDSDKFCGHEHGHGEHGHGDQGRGEHAHGHGEHTHGHGASERLQGGAVLHLPYLSAANEAAAHAIAVDAVRAALRAASGSGGPGGGVCAEAIDAYLAGQRRLLQAALEHCISSWV
jgi:hypothetical protein